ncbi:MAG: hypothetical protein PHX38_13440 [Sulfuricella sp.]|nr:hypothetical protein [Sulfuricella sp.]
MKRVNALLAGSLVVLGLAANGSALADRHGGHHGHGGAGVGVGLVLGLGLGLELARPYYGPGYYYPAPYYYAPPPYYYPPPVVVAPYAPPPVYIEQEGYTQAVPAQPPSSWYYCPGSKAYYPYVRQCPEGWERVSPQPPAP